MRKTWRQIFLFFRSDWLKVLVIDSRTVNLCVAGCSINVKAKTATVTYLSKAGNRCMHSLMIVNQFDAKTKSGETMLVNNDRKKGLQRELLFCRSS